MARIEVEIEDEVNEYLDYLERNFNVNKEEFLKTTIEREFFSRMYDLKNFSCL